MAAKIRLTRIGTKGKPYYRVIVIDESSARNASPIEILGQYVPGAEPSVFEVDKDKTSAWLKKGATPSPTVRKYLGKIGLISAVDYSKKKKKLSKAALAEAEAQKAQAPKETAAKAPEAAQAQAQQ